MKKGVIILGSTGSIGRSTLEVIESRRDEFEVVGLACRENVPIFNEQIQRFRPRFACLFQEGLAHRVDFGASRKLTGPEGLKELVGTDGEIVVNAMPGSAGLEPTIEALKCRKVLGLANKESLVMAGRLISSLARQEGVTLFPIDSEHSALYQLMQGLEKNEIESIIITASGGPFRDFSAEALRAATAEQALRHPTWRMGRKITIDSATLMNKGLEVIEAHWLFGIAQERIKVTVHPESVVHGMVQLIDGALLDLHGLPGHADPHCLRPERGAAKEHALRAGKPCRVRKAHVSCARLGAVSGAQARL